MFLMIERTNSVRSDISDWFVTCFGNERVILTVLTQKCSSVIEERCIGVNSLQNVFPIVVIKKLLIMTVFDDFDEFRPVCD